MKKYFSEILMGLLFVALGVFGYIQSSKFPALPGGMPGPGLFPRIISGFMTILGLILIIPVSLKYRKEGDITKNSGVSSQKDILAILRGISVPLVILAYVVLVRQLGFLLTMGMFNFVLFMGFKVKFATALILSVTVSILFYLLFTKLLFVPLPRGTLFI